MRTPTAITFRAAGWGLLHGALAWLTFGLIEHLCLSVLPAWRESSLLLLPGSRAATLGWTLGTYVIGGALLAAAVTVVVARPGRMAPDVATATLVVAWMPHVLEARGSSRSAYLSLALAGLLAAALAVRLLGRLPRLTGLTTWLTAPAGASACLVVPLVFRDQLHLSTLAGRLGPSAAAFKMAAAAGGSLLVVLLLVAGGGMTRPHDGRPAWRPRLLTAAALALALVVASMVLDRTALARLREGAAFSTTSPARGVLLVTLDAVRADHLTPYGYSRDTSPNLAALARQATLYLDARAASDMSLGTHASLFTGKYPSRHGAWAGGDFPIGRPLSASERTMAERVGAAGWVRFAAVANGYFLNAAYGLSRGFQLFDVPVSDRLELRWRAGTLVRSLSQRGPTVHRPAREVSGVLVEGFDAARRAGRPFLAFANYMEAHDPYAPDPDLVGRFPGYDRALPARVGAFIGAGGARRVFDPRERRHLVSLYDSAIATLDRELGLLFDRMRALGLYEGALIVVMADHGEMLGERGVFGHGAGLVDEVLRIPLIVKFPFQAEGRRVTAPVSQVDLLPTVLEMAGLPPDPALDGMSLQAAERAIERAVLAEAPPQRAVHRAGVTVLERIPATPGSLDPASVDRLKSLGYVR
jgi:arylsulfatase A-like enzyme